MPCVPGARRDWIAKIALSGITLTLHTMQIEELNKAALLQRIEELERQVRDLRHQLDVKTKLEAPAKTHWDKVSKKLYEALT